MFLMLFPSVEEVVYGFVPVSIYEYEMHDRISYVIVEPISVVFVLISLSLQPNYTVSELEK